MRRKTTLRDIARAVNVSEMTASRALRNSPDVSRATQKKVEAAARSLGYIPNRIAGALASQSVNLVGVVVPSLSNYVFPEVLAGLSSVLKNTAYQAVYGISDYDLETEEQVIREMLSWRPKGLIVAGLEHTDAATLILKASDTPVVEIMDVDGSPIDFCVGISHSKAGEKMARAILNKGYKNIGFIGTKMPLDYRAGKRLRGFEQTLSEAGTKIVDRELYAGASSIAKGRELTATMLERSPEIDCIYYSSDVMSAGGLMHCFANNISVPQQLALAGFNGLKLLEGLPKNLATANSSLFEIGQHAAEFILSAEEYPPNNARKILEIDSEIEFGDTL